MFVKMRKSVGSKRKELSANNIAEITRVYEAFAESKHSKIFRTEDFFYRTITVERPLKVNFAFTAERIERVMASRPVAKLPDDDAVALRSALHARSQRAAGEVSTNKSAFTSELLDVLAEAGLQVKPAVLKSIVTELSERDEDGELQTNRVRDPEPDPTLRDTENVPWDQDIHEYLEREVKPFVADAWIDESKTKEGAEIPFTRHFYEYVPPRPLEEIDRDLEEVLGHIRARLEEVKG
ncbi:hypothetical protein M3B14_07420 [Kocuria marina]|uniref:hypothetical protein n=1 Tax=Kocuria marina TaxID=223184 RepID=UPI002989D74E|nr:hypothetical protein [Kocuria marina]MCT1723436.1 hypothetical protein [Kocuria marina]MCT1735445.1 hypothetical protein [Kocuria marina]